MDGETDDESIERLRRVYAELGEGFDEGAVRRMLAAKPKAEHRSLVEQYLALVEFDSERKQLAGTQGVPW
jgi:hypothetical protein